MSASTQGPLETPIHLGRQTHVWDAEVVDDTKQKTIASFRCTQMVLPAR